jgi:hypothetical protein
MRFVIGVAVGFASVVVPLQISDGFAQGRVDLVSEPTRRHRRDPRVVPGQAPI